MEIVISPDIRQHLDPRARIATVRCSVTNGPTDDALWHAIETEAAAIIQAYPNPQDVNLRPGIRATRLLYKACGKDPNRYRGSCEAMCRRIIRRLGLYRINALVDVINLLSIHSGYALGGFDADKIVGNTLTLTIGSADDHFEGIGRGQLNIEGMPVYKDAIGGIGTPTSDNERTKIDLNTSRLHLNINAFAPEMPMDQMLSWTEEMLRRHVGATDFETAVYNAH